MQISRKKWYNTYGETPVSVSPKITEARRSRTTFSNAGRRMSIQNYVSWKNVLQEWIKNKKICSKQNFHLKTSHRNSLQRKGRITKEV